MKPYCSTVAKSKMFQESSLCVQKSTTDETEPHVPRLWTEPDRKWMLLFQRGTITEIVEKLKIAD